MARKRTRPKNNLFAVALILAGILLLAIGTLTHAAIYYRLVVTQKEQVRKEVLYAVPASLSIPARGINVGVDQGGIVSGEWVLSDINALYLPSSGRLGEGYNTIIYAHDTDKLFGKLKNIKIGDEISLANTLGKEFKYKVFTKQDVDPTDLGKLYSSEKNIITLFTCDGWFDKKRLLVQAKLVKACSEVYCFSK